MNSAHSLSAFRGSCVVQPRHPKTKLPTTSVERKSFDFAAVNRQTSFSSGTSGHSSEDEAEEEEVEVGENGHVRRGRERTSNRLSNRLLNGEETIAKSQQKKGRKRHNLLKQKNLSASNSKSSVPIDRAPQHINNLGGHSECAIDVKTLSLEDDLFFRNLQALKEENKRALRTLEKLYNFGQEEDEVEEEEENNKNNSGGGKATNKRKTSEEHISEDSGVSRSSNGRGVHDVNFIEVNNNNFVETENSFVGTENEMPAESIEGNVVYRINDPHLSSNSDHGFVESGLHSDSSGDNGFAQRARFANANMENAYKENGYGKMFAEHEHGMKGYGKGVRRSASALGRRNSFHVGSGGGHHHQPIRYEDFSHQMHRDFVADMDKRAKAERERTRNSESSEEDELSQKLHVDTPPSHVNILPENDKSFRGRPSNYEVIRNMWNNFSVDDMVPPYIHRNGAGRTNMRKKQRQSWSPTVTVQEPFKMTLREEKNKDLKQKKIERIKDELLKKKLEEEAELKKRVVPTPVPPSTFLPMYSEQQHHQQQKKQYMKELSKHILKSTEKPFSFVQREETKNKLKRSQSMYTKSTQKPTQITEDRRRASFKANPIPDHLFDLTWKDKQAEQEEYRKIKRKLRSQELLASSSLPPSMKTRGDLDKFRKPRGNNKENNNNGSSSNHNNSNKNNKNNSGKHRPFQPQVHHNIPDFEEMQRKIELALEARKNRNTPTVVEPFDLHTARVANRRNKFNETLKVKVPSSPPNSAHARSGSALGRRNTVTGRDLQFRRGSNVRPSSGNSIRDRSGSLHSGDRSGSLHSGSLLSRSRSCSPCSPVYSVTEAHRRRQEHIQQTAEKEKQQRARIDEERKQKQKEISKLQKVVAKKTAAHDPSRFRERETAEKLASFRQAEKERHREYKAFLKSVEQKNEQRPLLFERESQINAKRKAQRRYEEILRRAGIDGKTLEAFLVGDKSLQRKLNRVINSDNDNEDEDITLKSEMGYDVVLKSNNNSSRSCENIEDDDDDEDDDYDEDEDEFDDEDEDEEDEDDEDDDDEEDSDEDDDNEDDDVVDHNADDGDADDDDDDGDDRDDDQNEINGHHNGNVESDDGSYKPS